MILLIGQIARKDLDREAFQEIDYRQMFSPVAKWVAQIDDAKQQRGREPISNNQHRARGGDQKDEKYEFNWNHRGHPPCSHVPRALRQTHPTAPLQRMPT